MKLPFGIVGLRRQVLTAFALKGAAAVFSFALNWLIAHQFGAQGVGHFAIALTTAVFTSTFALAGLDFVLLRTVAVEHAAERTGVARTALFRIAKQTGLAALVLGGLLLLARDFIAGRFMAEPGVAPFLGIMAFLVPTWVAVRLASAALRGVGSITISQLIDGPIGTGLTAVVLGAAILGGMADSSLLPAALYCLFWAGAAAFGWLVLARTIRHCGPAGSFEDSLLRAGLPILCVGLSNLFVDWFATISLGAMRGPADAGLFRVAFQIVATLNLVVVAVEAILAPVIAASYSQGDNARIASVSRKAALAMFAVASPLFLVILIAPGWLMGIFGPAFVAGSTAVQILALGQAVNLLTGPVGTILIMTKHERWSLVYASAGAVLAAILSLLLIPRFGVNGAAIAVAATIAFRNFSALLIVQRVIGINFLFGRSNA